MIPKFITKIEESQSQIILNLNPQFEKLPLPITWYDDPFLPFGKKIIDATHDLVAGYLFDFASYLAMGGAGVVALERTLAYVPHNKARILHGAFTGQSYSPMADVTGFDLDAITVMTTDDVRYYTENIPFMAFIVASQAQELPAKGGIYRTDSNQLVYNFNTSIQYLTTTTDNDLYCSKQDNFAEKVRERIQALS